MTHEAESHEAPFWHLDEELGELDLWERPGGPDRYTVRLKARTDTMSYRARSELYPLQQDGTEHEVSGKAYILVPDITLTVGLYPEEQPYGEIGRVTDSDWRGMRHHEIASVRGLYYQEDQALAVWEVDDYGKLDDFAQGQLWQAFECWLILHFPDATHIFTDDSEPGENREDNEEFLVSLGYHRVAGTNRIFQKEVSAQQRQELHARPPK